MAKKYPELSARVMATRIADISPKYRRSKWPLIGLIGLGISAAITFVILETIL